MKEINFQNRGQSLIGIIIVLVVVGLIGGGLYYYFSKQIPEVSKITEKLAEEEIAPEEKIAEEVELGEEESELEIKKCVDGTPHGQCAIGEPRIVPGFAWEVWTGKPKYCDRGVIVNKCSLCGCPSGLECQVGEGCMKPNPPYICGCSPGKECQRAECKIADPLVVVVINSSIYSSLQSSLNQYKADLEKEGYVVKFHPVGEGTPEDLRSYLQGELSNNLVGALLIGDLSLPWFLHGEGESERKFPIDLFYMDLNGSWFDTDNDGIYDQHENGSGDILPEIWVGRLIPPEGFGELIDLLNNYFRKNHAYRMGELTLPQRALAYFAFPNYPWVNTLSSIYNGNVTVVLPEQSSAKDYLNKLSQGYQFVNMLAHGGHCFDIPEWSCFSPDELYQIDPKVFFYDIIGCGACDYTHPYQYIGGTCVFTPSYGLAVLGALTETGGLGFSERLYSFFAANNTLGDSYKEFLANEILTENFTCNRSSMGETVLLGDPTLRLTP